MTDHGLFLDGCSALAANVKETLVLSGERPTAEAVRRFVATMPASRSDPSNEWWRTQFCYRTLERARQRNPDSLRLMKLRDYFLAWGERDPAARALIEAAFEGVLSVDYEPLVEPLPEFTVLERRWWEVWR